MKRASRLGALGAALILAGCTQEPPKLAPPKPAVVLVRQPVSDNVSDYEEFTGRIDAVYSTEVRARVTGYLDSANFKEGDEVQEKDLLFVIDPRPYQTELDRTESTVLQTEARLKRLDAEHRRALSNYSRGAISREEFDRTAGDLEETQAALGIAKANRDLAKLNLEFTQVRARISGRISRRWVDPGNLVKADETILTTIVSLDPMHVYFDVDERTLLRLRRLSQEGKIKSRREGNEISVLVELADESDFPHKGAINFSDNRVDPSTGTLRVRAVIPNPKSSGNKPRTFSPGLFVRVRLPIGDPHRALLVPEQAVGTDQGRKFLYLVGPKNEVIYRPVTVGPLEKELRVIEAGLAPNDRVIVSGLQRIKAGAKVDPKAFEDPKELGKGPVASGEPSATPRKGSASG
jgi:RND family efflux transporter MFP subunit